jgi:streptomycin 6-kinase
MSPNEDRRLTEAFGAFDPSPERVAGIAERVFEARPAALPVPSLGALAREWQALLAARPAQNGVLVAAAATLLLVASPLALLPLAFLS